MAFDENDKDSFWSLDKLVPKKNASMQRFATQPTVTDYVIESPNTSYEKNNDQGRLSFTDNSGEPERFPDKIYTPEKGLLKKITVKHIPDKYDFHANFAKAAKLYYDFYTHECEFSKIYSYMPQYSQLTHSQKEYYFYWRYCVRHGRYIKTDYAYFYLYIYEIINLPDIISPKDGLSLMIDVWCAYHKELPNINANMALWVQDYCMIYGVECPMDRIKDFVFYSIGSSVLKEFYLSGAEALGDDGVSTLLAYLSDYDWRSTRILIGEKSNVYATHMVGAMTSFFKKMFSTGMLFSDSDESLTVERSAFRGALTTSVSKYRITVEYKPLLENVEIRRNVTAAVKYTENKLRALLGVKSRLSVKDFSDEYKTSIDRYFESLFALINRKRQLEQRPEYERLYDAESTGISGKDAENIENSSWNLTMRLVTEDEICEEADKNDNIPDTLNKAEQNNDLIGLSPLHGRFVKAILDEDLTLASEVAASMGGNFDSLADEINSAFADCFDDIILEPYGDVYRIIEDYKEDVEKWLKKIMK